VETKNRPLEGIFMVKITRLNNILNAILTNVFSIDLNIEHQLKTR
jgi:hypothetical protein